MKTLNQNGMFALIGLSVIATFSNCTSTKSFTTAKASLDFANTLETGDSEIKYDSRTNMNIVVYHDVPLTGTLMENLDVERDDTVAITKPVPYFGVGAGIEYIGKGAKSQNGGGTVGLNYLEIPMHLLYHYPLQTGSLYAGFGPYFAYGIGGQIKATGFQESSFGEDNGGYKRFDFGLGLMVGYRLDMGASLDLSYDFGLANIAYSDLDVSSHNRCFSINIGYEIGHLFSNR